MTKYIFVTGGVCSSLGKGIVVSSISVLLQAAGYKLSLRKLDPYINVSPGNMGPDQHGEVYVTADGLETDLDLGHYERFSGIECSKIDNITSGKIYQDVINKEYQGEYLGETVQVIPHITDRIKDFILNENINADFQIIEIGGTVGDIEGLPFLEAIRQISKEITSDNVLFIHMTLVPFLPSAREIKTKPTQHSIKELQSIGIDPHILICRSIDRLSDDSIRKIANLCGIKKDLIITCPDVNNIYKIPLLLKMQNLDQKIIHHFFKDNNHNCNINNSYLLDRWVDFIDRADRCTKEIDIILIGKYKSQDAYKSIYESLKHSGTYHGIKVNINFVDSEENQNLQDKIIKSAGVIVAGGFGARATEGKIQSIQIARENNIPILGICYGMQMMAIEFARNVLNIHDADSTEICLENKFPIIDSVNNRKMRLGNYSFKLLGETLAHKIYNNDIATERHRHRYCINNNLFEKLQECGLICSGKSVEDNIVEIIELKGHNWFIGVQFHPEFKSTPFQTHPLFNSFIEAALLHNNK